MLPVTSLFAGVLALMLVALSINVIRGRIKHRVALADGGEQDMIRRIRAQGNFCEYVPLALLLMAMAELQNASHPFLYAMGVLLLAGRLLHAYSLLKAEPSGKGIKARQAGMIMTFLTLVMGAGFALSVAAAGQG